MCDFYLKIQSTTQILQHFRETHDFITLTYVTQYMLLKASVLKKKKKKKIRWTLK